MRLLDLVLPQRCLACREPGTALCRSCSERLQYLRPPLCDRCGAPTAWPVVRCRECAGRRLAFSSARAAVAYDADVKAVVAGWKEHGLRTLAALAAELIAGIVERPQVDALVPVPADTDRGLKRGHNPSASLAAELGRRWELPAEALLARSRAVPRQRGLSLAARRQNVAGAFVANGTVPRRVAVVDDVYTSGATAAATAAALRRAGARRVEIITFARAIRGR